MEYLVPCACGRSVEVGAAQAGSAAACFCGQTVAIPRLGELRKMSVAGLAQPRASQNTDVNAQVNNSNPFAAPASLEMEEFDQPANSSILPPWFRFSGRASRAQYWAVSLTKMVGIWFCVILATGSLQMALVALICLFVLMWMGLATSVRRCHDREKSGIFLIIYIIPLGPLWLLVELGFLPGTSGPNRYGPDPVSAIWHTG